MKALQRKIDTYINDNEQGSRIKKKKQSGAQCYEESVLVYFTWCRSGFERCWKTKEIEMNNEVTKFSTIILGVDRFLLLLMAFEGGHY